MRHLRRRMPRHAAAARRIVNLDGLRFTDWGQGARHRARIAWLGGRLGARRLGFNVAVVPPGKAAFPYHLHHANEELFLVLEGRGTMRIGRERVPVRKGDLICLPAGKETAHQMLNTSTRPLRYLAVSTMEAPDVAEYPDSGKIGVFTGVAPGGRPRRRDRRLYIPIRHRVGYWEGEE